MGDEACRAVAAEGIAPNAVAVRRRLVNLRFAGQEAVVTVELPAADTLEAAFRAAYRGLYGYDPEGRSIEVESLRVVASSREPPLDPPASGGKQSDAFHSPVHGGTEGGPPAWDRGRLARKATFSGPCLVFEPHSATWVAPGWHGRVDDAGNLVLQSERR
jgi:N-methylhydantoinase A/oxoprolinase/acetone carboxylase beta subunit